MIRYACPSCSAEVESPDGAAGFVSSCPLCAAPVLVPQPLPRVCSPFSGIEQPGPDSWSPPPRRRSYRDEGNGEWGAFVRMLVWGLFLGLLFPIILGHIRYGEAIAVLAFVIAFAIDRMAAAASGH